MTKKVEIFTDGACSGNPGPGGWGAILRYKGVDKEISGGKKDTTNNQMEMKAVIEALNSLTSACDVIVYSDSKYVIDGSTKWLSGWKAKGWKNSAKQAVKNKGLWIELDEAIQKHNVSWQWVKGHSGHPENERADQLAVDAVPRD